MPADGFWVVKDGFKQEQKEEPFRGVEHQRTPRSVWSVFFVVGLERSVFNGFLDSFIAGLLTLVNLVVQILFLGVILSEDGHELVPIWLWLKNGYQNGTLVSGNTRNPSCLILSHSHFCVGLKGKQGNRSHTSAKWVPFGLSSTIF